MNYLNDVLFGVIEGITEFLPISSTGHLLLAQHWLGDRSDLYTIVIQAGAILAVTLIYWGRIVGLLTNWQDPENRDYLVKLSVAFLITAVLGVVVKAFGFELPETITPIAWALVLGAFWMIWAEYYADKLEDQSAILWRVAIAVGVAQIVAGVFPGLSRSGTTIFVAMVLGTSNRPAATEFAFLVGIPTMYAASAFEIFGELRDGGGNEDWGSLGVGFLVSTVTAFIAVKWLLGFIRSNKFTVFSIYRLIFGGLLLALSAFGVVA